MNSKADDKVVKRPGSDRPRFTVLRPARGVRAARARAVPDLAELCSKVAPDGRLQRLIWNGDTDDPGPILPPI